MSVFDFDKFILYAWLLRRTVVFVPTFTLTIVNFAGDATVTGLMSNINESAYRAEVQNMKSWCLENNMFFIKKNAKWLILTIECQRRPFRQKRQCKENA